MDTPMSELVQITQAMHALHAMTLDNGNSIIEKMSGLSINSTEESPIDSGYELNQSLEIIQEVHYVTNIKMNFYQIWSIFGVLPNVYEKGKSGYLNDNCKYYEYKIKGPNAFFTVGAWNMKGSFLQENKWNISTTTNNQSDIKSFLEHLYKALELYSTHYKMIEKHIFQSTNEEIDMHLKRIKQELIENRETLKSL